MNLVLVDFIIHVKNLSPLEQFYVIIDYDTGSLYKINGYDNPKDCKYYYKLVEQVDNYIIKEAKKLLIG